MKLEMIITAALFTGLSSIAEARSIQIPVCTQIAGIAKHKSSGVCLPFSNGCELSQLFKSGYEVANAESCLRIEEFASKPAPAPLETSIMPPLPSTQTMICNSVNFGKPADVHTVRLAVITGKSLSSGGAMIEITQSSLRGHYAPLALLASDRYADVSAVGARKAGRYLDNEKEMLSLFIPGYQPMDTPYRHGQLKLGKMNFAVRCRSIVY